MARRPRTTGLRRRPAVVLQHDRFNQTRLATAVVERTGVRKLCLAGGVALNCVANGKILREGPFESIWIQPAAGDAGGALGAALAACGPVSVERAERECLERARGALHPRGTVEVRRHAIFAKVGAGSVAELVRMYLEVSPDAK